MSMQGLSIKGAAALETPLWHCQQRKPGQNRPGQTRSGPNHNTHHLFPFPPCPPSLSCHHTNLCLFKHALCCTIVGGPSVAVQGPAVCRCACRVCVCVCGRGSTHTCTYSPTTWHLQPELALGVCCRFCEDSLLLCARLSLFRGLLLLAPYACSLSSPPVLSVPPSPLSSVHTQHPPPTHTTHTCCLHAQP